MAQESQLVVYNYKIQITMSKVIPKLFKLSCKLSEISLDISLNCGQSFRWKKRTNGEWVGVFHGFLWVLTQNEDSISYHVLNFTEPKNNLSDDVESKYEEILKDYFQWSINLGDLYAEWSKADPNFSKIAQDYQGVRMLRQDPVENLFCFICSSNNNIQRISSMVEKLCQTYGTLLIRHGDTSYYNFPTIESLADPEVEGTLRNLGFGYRAKFIQQSAVKILENGGRDWLMNLRNVTYQEAKTALMTLPGIGAKVADCICLMSLNHSCAIPVDTHVFQIAKANYIPHLKATKSVTDRVYNEISNHFQTLFGPHAGWAHSVLFSADLRHLKLKADDQKRNNQDKEPIQVNKKKRKQKETF